MTATDEAFAQDGIGRVAGLWRYPASSLGGESLDHMAVASDGVVGDRLFGLVDATTGEIARPDANRKWHGAPRILARLAGDGGLEVRIPDGELRGGERPGGDWLAAPSDAADRAAGAFLGFAASIRRLAGPAPDGAPALSPRYAKAAIHLLTTASLAELKRLHPGGDPDPRRFRPNIVVDMPPLTGRFPETEWIGRKLAIGDVEMTVSEPCRRCGFTLIAQDGIANDPDILRTLVRSNSHNLGVYCDILKPGIVRSGDIVRRIA